LALPQNVLIFCGIEHILLYHRVPLWLKRSAWRARMVVDADVAHRVVEFARGNVKLNA
jgi:hypothetical protein